MSETTQEAAPQQTNSNSPSIDAGGIDQFLAEMGGEQKEAAPQAVPEAAQEKTPPESKEESIDDMFDKIENENNPKEPPVKDEPAPIVDLGKLEKFTFEGKEYTPKEFKEAGMRLEDYTKKTMALAQGSKDVQSRQASLESMEAKAKESLTKNAERLNQLEELDYFVDHLADIDPDFLDSLKSKLNGFRSNYTNPVVNGLKKKISELESVFQKNDEAREIAKIKSAYDQELATIQKDLFPELESIGLKVNMEEVNELWKSGADLGISLKQALYAKHGEDIRRLYQSKSKVNKVEKEVSVTPKIVASSSSRSLPAKEKVDTKNMSWKELGDFLGGVDLAS